MEHVVNIMVPHGCNGRLLPTYLSVVMQESIKDKREIVKDERR